MLMDVFSVLITFDIAWHVALSRGSDKKIQFLHLKRASVAGSQHLSFTLMNVLVLPGALELINDDGHRFELLGGYSS
ncbi:hypothetical protein [Pseudomonas sp. CMR5c]|uniref:hypothetical protein n=1 Tax=Pseudomonas TaxID=286 RepID=UPI00069EDEB7|nr:hypothetical protein [Pseudomonas sp. CMR5c]